jgi:RNA polymerase sigma-70 factor (ECF subfamily)
MNGDPGSTSISLLQQLRQGGSEVWAGAIKLYAPLVFKWCRSSGLSEVDSEDVGQNVFLSAFHGFPRFRKDREGDTFRGWLRRITQRKISDFRTGKRRQPISIDEPTLLYADPIAELNADDAPEDLKLLALRAVEILQTQFSSEAMKSFIGTAIDERSAFEVGRELGMTANAVNIAKYRVIKALRLALGDVDPDSGQGK